MSDYLFKYFKCKSDLPSPNSPLSQKLSSAIIQTANDSVLSVISTVEGNGSDGKKRGPYVKLSSKDKARIGNYAVTHGTSVAIKHFHTEFPYLKWMTVNDWKIAMTAKMRQAHSICKFEHRFPCKRSNNFTQDFTHLCMCCSRVFYENITKYFRIHETFITKYLIESKIRKITKVFYLESLELYGSSYKVVNTTSTPIGV